MESSRKTMRSLQPGRYDANLLLVIPKRFSGRTGLGVRLAVTRTPISINDRNISQRAVGRESL